MKKWVCSVCGYVYKEASVLPVGDHSFGNDGICTVCGKNKVTSDLLAGKIRRNGPEAPSRYGRLSACR